jgi:hypothetical protein
VITAIARSPFLNTKTTASRISVGGTTADPNAPRAKSESEDQRAKGVFPRRALGDDLEALEPWPAKGCIREDKSESTRELLPAARDRLGQQMRPLERCTRLAEKLTGGQ